MGSLERRLDGHQDARRGPGPGRLVSMAARREERKGGECVVVLQAGRAGGDTHGRLSVTDFGPAAQWIPPGARMGSGDAAEKPLNVTPCC